LKFLVVDDHALVREGLHQVLKSLNESVDVLQAGNCMQAFAFAQIHRDIDLVLLDYHLPDMNGIDALAIFGERHPQLPVVVLSGSANVQIMQQVLQSGACGFVNKSSLCDELLEAVRLVLNGDVYVPSELQTAAAMPSDALPATLAKTPLTQRQELVLRCLLDGMSNREIGDVLHVSEETIKNHITAILRYFDVQNRTQAVVAAARAGFKAVNDH